MKKIYFIFSAFIILYAGQNNGFASNNRAARVARAANRFNNALRPSQQSIVDKLIKGESTVNEAFELADKYQYDIKLDVKNHLLQQIVGNKLNIVDVLKITDEKNIDIRADIKKYLYQEVINNRLTVSKLIQTADQNKIDIRDNHRNLDLINYLTVNNFQYKNNDLRAQTIEYSLNNNMVLGASLLVVKINYETAALKRKLLLNELTDAQIKQVSTRIVANNFSEIDALDATLNDLNKKVIFQDTNLTLATAKLMLQGKSYADAKQSASIEYYQVYLHNKLNNSLAPQFGIIAKHVVNDKMTLLNAVNKVIPQQLFKDPFSNIEKNYTNNISELIVNNKDSLASARSKAIIFDIEQIINGKLPHLDQQITKKLAQDIFTNNSNFKNMFLDYLKNNQFRGCQNLVNDGYELIVNKNHNINRALTESIFNFNLNYIKKDYDFIGHEDLKSNVAAIMSNDKLILSHALLAYMNNIDHPLKSYSKQIVELILKDKHSFDNACQLKHEELIKIKLIEKNLNVLDDNFIQNIVKSSYPESDIDKSMLTLVAQMYPQNDVKIEDIYDYIKTSLPGSKISFADEKFKTNLKIKSLRTQYPNLYNFKIGEIQVNDQILTAINTKKESEAIESCVETILNRLRLGSSELSGMERKELSKKLAADRNLSAISAFKEAIVLKRYQKLCAIYNNIDEATAKTILGYQYDKEIANFDQALHQYFIDQQYLVDDIEKIKNLILNDKKTIDDIYNEYGCLTVNTVQANYPQFTDNEIQEIIDFNKQNMRLKNADVDKITTAYINQTYDIDCAALVLSYYTKLPTQVNALTLNQSVDKARNVQKIMGEIEKFEFIKPKTDQSYDFRPHIKTVAEYAYEFPKIETANGVSTTAYSIEKGLAKFCGIELFDRIFENDMSEYASISNDFKKYTVENIVKKMLDGANFEAALSSRTEMFEESILNQHFETCLQTINSRLLDNLKEDEIKKISKTMSYILSDYEIGFYVLDNRAYLQRFSENLEIAMKCYYQNILARVVNFINVHNDYKIAYINNLVNIMLTKGFSKDTAINEIEKLVREQDQILRSHYNYLPSNYKNEMKYAVALASSINCKKDILTKYLTGLTANDPKKTSINLKFNIFKISTLGTLNSPKDLYDDYIANLVQYIHINPTQSFENVIEDHRKSIITSFNNKLQELSTHYSKVFSNNEMRTITAAVFASEKELNQVINEFLLEKISLDAVQFQTKIQTAYVNDLLCIKSFSDDFARHIIENKPNNSFKESVDEFLINKLAGRIATKDPAIKLPKNQIQKLARVCITKNLSIENAMVDLIRSNSKLLPHDNRGIACIDRDEDFLAVAKHIVAGNTPLEAVYTVLVNKENNTDITKPKTLERKLSVIRKIITGGNDFTNTSFNVTDFNRFKSFVETNFNTAHALLTIKDVIMDEETEPSEMCTLGSLILHFNDGVNSGRINNDNNSRTALQKQFDKIRTLNCFEAIKISEITSQQLEVKARQFSQKDLFDFAKALVNNADTFKGLNDLYDLPFSYFVNDYHVSIRRFFNLMPLSVDNHNNDFITLLHNGYADADKYDEAYKQRCQAGVAALNVLVQNSLNPQHSQRNYNYDPRHTKYRDAVSKALVKYETNQDDYIRLANEANWHDVTGPRYKLNLKNVKCDPFYKPTDLGKEYPNNIDDQKYTQAYHLLTNAITNPGHRFYIGNSLNRIEEHDIIHCIKRLFMWGGDTVGYPIDDYDRPSLLQGTEREQYRKRLVRLVEKKLILLIEENNSVDINKLLFTNIAQHAFNCINGSLQVISLYESSMNLSKYNIYNKLADTIHNQRMQHLRVTVQGIRPDTYTGYMHTEFASFLTIACNSLLSLRDPLERMDNAGCTLLSPDDLDNLVFNMMRDNHNNIVKWIADSIDYNYEPEDSSLSSKIYKKDIEDWAKTSPFYCNSANLKADLYNQNENVFKEEVIENLLHYSKYIKVCNRTFNWENE